MINMQLLSVQYPYMRLQTGNVNNKQLLDDVEHDIRFLSMLSSKLPAKAKG